MWLGPPVYAFGTSLRFSITRYVVALLFVAFAALQLSLRVRGTIAGPFVIPLGGGALGIVLTLTLGNIGLAIRRWIMRFAQR